jgi:5'-3' exonuclease
MGVKGLWRLLLPIGRRISIETLEGKVLAIDASIWLVQFLKAMRDPDNGKVRHAAHLIGFLRRICKLRYQGIRPVFVFDGATPEIKLRELRDRRKRREQFSSLDSEDAIQRMARRLLAQQLKKEGSKLTIMTSKKQKEQEENSRTNKNKDDSNKTATEQVAGITTSATSYAPGFYDPQMDEEQKRDEASSSNNQENKDTASKDPEPMETETTKLDDVKKISDNEKDIIDLLKDDPLEAANAQEEEQPSDWDTAIIPEAASLGGETTTEETKTKKGDIRTYANTNKYKFNAGYVASLPSTERKGVVEDAQRRRRLESRREFMKVAYDPDGLSQCQLRNFLKSTKLNKNIKKMALQAAKNDGVDTTSASDRTRKIIFVKDITSDATSLKEQRNRRIRKLAEETKKKGLSIMNSSSSEEEKSDNGKDDDDDDDEHDDDDDDDIEWEDSETKTNGVQASSASNAIRRRAIVDDDSDDDDDEEEEEEEGGFFKNAIAGVDSTTTVPFHSSPPKATGEQEATNRDARMAQELQDHDLARALQKAASEDEDGEEGGGFLPSNAQVSDNAKRSQQAKIHVHDSGEEGGRGFLPTNSEHVAKRAARPIINIDEDDAEDGGGFLPSSSDSDLRQPARRRIHINDDDEDSGGGFLPSNSDSDLKPAARQIINIDDDDDDEEGGGFLPANLEPDSSNRAARILLHDDANDYMKRHNAKSKPDNDAVFAQELQDEELARGLQQSEYSEEGGGFLPQDLGESYVAVAARSTAEERIARRLQHIDPRTLGFLRQSDESEGEESETAGFLPESAHKEYVNDIPATDSNPLQQHHAGRDEGSFPSSHQQPIEESRLNALKNRVNCTRSREHQTAGTRIVGTFDMDKSSEEEEDDLDWEDGDCEDVVVEVAYAKTKDGTTQGAPQNIRNINPVQRSSIGGSVKETSSSETPRKTVSFARRGASGSAQIPNQQRNDDDDDDDGGGSVDWEDGPAGQEWHKREDKPSRSAPFRGTEEIPERSQMVEDVEACDNPEQYGDIGDSWGGDFLSKPQKPKEVAAALEHAQETAENLTNWAGRAFRRAVAQHAQENGMDVPEAAKPKPLLDTKESSPTKVVYNREKETTLPTRKDPVVSSESRSKNSNSNKPSTTDNATRSERINRTALLESLEEYQEEWQQERNQQERDMDTVTDEMRDETMQLLRLFGVPYVEAPAEAEAQCVMLEKLGLVDGVVTEDSDAFVFGAQSVYRNIFEDRKYVEIYHAKDAEQEMNLTHDALVALAMLLGGDYTEGVRGVGIVNGMEILEAFDVADGLQEGLVRFREWLNGFDPTDIIPIQKGKEDANDERVFHRKHYTARARWVAPKHFPDPKVLNAYLNPVVDTSRDRFSWGVPDLEKLLVFCNRHIGWNAIETTQLLEPVIEKIENRSMQQTRIDSFMRYEDGIKFASVRSKRLRDILGKVKEKGAKKQKRKDDSKSKHF